MTLVFLSFSLLPLVSAQQDLVFRLPHQQYTLGFSAAAGGCLVNITDDTDRESNVLAGPAGPACGAAGPTTFAVRSRNATALVALATTARGATTVLHVVDTLDRGAVIRAVPGSSRDEAGVASTIIVNTLVAPWSPASSYRYTADGASVPRLGAATRSVGIVRVSNWGLTVTCAAAGAGGPAAACIGAANATPASHIEVATPGFELHFLRLI